MDGLKNLYVVLGVSEDATSSEIKKSYRSLSLVHHPDKGGSIEKFQELNDAYESLSDPKTRAAYDEMLKAIRLQLENGYSELLKQRRREEREAQEQDKEEGQEEGHQ